MKPLEVRRTVEKIISDVRREGDSALIRLAAKFDKVRLSPATLRVSRARIQASERNLSAQSKNAIRACARRIEIFHKAERKALRNEWSIVDAGVRLGQRLSAIDSVGLYVPGGRFAYPSTVLMTGIPARIAGVRRIAMVTPPARLSDEILFAAKLAGVNEIYQVGGPAGLAAISIGTKSIPKVDLIVGPGNALVTEAKRQLFGEVGIDLLAGPSELVVIADDSAQARFIAADMSAQAEHDPDSKSFLVTSSRALAASVKEILPAEFRKQCAFFALSSMSACIDKANALAGEHVEVIARNASAVVKKLKNGGTIFVNSYSPTAMGDYWAGPSHVLPTGRSARFGSGLSVMTFMKRSSIVEISRAAYKKGWKAAYGLAQIEGLVRHAESLKVRMEN